MKTFGILAKQMPKKAAFTASAFLSNLSSTETEQPSFQKLRYILTQSILFEIRSEGSFFNLTNLL